MLSAFVSLLFISSLQIDRQAIKLLSIAKDSQQIDENIHEVKIETQSAKKGKFLSTLVS